MRSKTCDNCEHYQSEICPIYNTKLPFEKCPNHWTKHRQTVFDRITESPGTLAEKLVFEIFCKEDPNIKGWTSAFTDVHETREEALAATVAKLRAVE